MTNLYDYRIAICELGWGTIWSCNQYKVPGASRWMMHSECPYKPANTEIDRRVSREFVETKANEMLAKANNLKTDTAPGLGICFSGATYDKFAHAWLCIKTNKIRRTLHFHYNMENSTTSNRSLIQDHCSMIIQNSLAKLLAIVPGGFRELFTSIAALSTQLTIDAYDDENQSFLDILLERVIYRNLSCAIKNGRIQRIIDVIREHKTLYSGSFNPPTKAHEFIGKDALWELSTVNADKGIIGTEDLMHRINMLQLINVPVFITAASTFHKKWEILRPQPTLNQVTMGFDTFERLINPKYNQGLDLKEISELWLNKEIVVVCNKNEATEDYIKNHSNYYTAKVEFSVFDNVPNGRSSDVRKNCSMELVNAKVANYIRSRNLYGFQ